MSTLYSPEPIEDEDLQRFATIARNALTSTPHGREYAPSLVLIALCQGGGNHYAVTHQSARRYLDPAKKGLKDIDLWCFFNRPGFHPMWQQHLDFGLSKFGRSPEEPDYVGRRVDVYGRSITIATGESVQSALQRWLRRGKRDSSPWYLASKAVVAIHPANLRGQVLWVNPELR